MKLDFESSLIFLRSHGQARKSSRTTKETKETRCTRWLFCTGWEWEDSLRGLLVEPASIEGHVLYNLGRTILNVLKVDSNKRKLNAGTIRI